MTTIRRMVNKPVTKPGKHGTLYHYIITYTDSSWRGVAGRVGLSKGKFLDPTLEVG
jgi:hypothetical protein